MRTQITPRIFKAALINLDLLASPQTIVFQYNPERLSRSLQAQTSGEGGDRSEALRLDGAPTETLQFEEVTFDTIDQLVHGDLIAVDVGILPQLSVLEVLLYPRSSTVIANPALLAAGTIEIIPPESPLTLLVWGKRVLPVRLTEYSVIEQMHDADLNPIRANLSLSLRVLSYNDFSYTHPGYYAFLTHQVGKEALAAVATVNNLSEVGSAIEGVFRGL